MAKELKGKGGFWDIPILGQIANVLYTAGSDVLGVTGQASGDVANTVGRAAVDVGDTASGGLLQESLKSGLGADKAQLASMAAFGLNPNKAGKVWQGIKKIAPWLLIGGGAASQFLGESDEEYNARMIEEEKEKIRQDTQDAGGIYSEDLAKKYNMTIPSDTLGVDLNEGLINEAGVRDSLFIDNLLKKY